MFETRVPMISGSAMYSAKRRRQPSRVRRHAGFSAITFPRQRLPPHTAADDDRNHARLQERTDDGGQPSRYLDESADVGSVSDVGHKAVVHPGTADVMLGRASLPPPRDGRSQERETGRRSEQLPGTIGADHIELRTPPRA